MRKNRAFQKLREGKAICGPFITLGSPEAAEIAAHSGFDWALLDWQHGHWTEERLMAAISTFLAVETVPIVRVRGHDAWEINRVLDMGAMGVVVPMVHTPEQAEQVVRGAKFTPQGGRSGGGVRLALVSDGGDVSDYFDNANDETMVIVMVETVRAINKAEEIMSVPGVDVVLVGPGDLLMDVRANGGDEAERDRLVDSLLEPSRKTGIAVGYVCGTPEEAKPYIDRGFRFVCVGDDGHLVRSGLRGVAHAIKSWR